MDITLADLTLLESRLSPGSGTGDREPDPTALSRTEVSWAVTARATAPHLPALRGGELLLIPPRVSAEIADELPALVDQALSRDVSGLAFAISDPVLSASGLACETAPILRWHGDLTDDVESSINRLLTEYRGTMFRVGTELERALNEMTTRPMSLSETLERVSTIAGIAVSVTDAKGREIARSAQVEEGDEAAGKAETRFLSRDLALGARLVLGPLTPRESVLARFLIDRISVAAEMSLRHDDQLRPRGAGRAIAIHALLERGDKTPSERRRSAIALGLDPDGIYIVAVTSDGLELAKNHALALVGTVHAAGEVDRNYLWLVAVAANSGPEHVATRAQQLKRGWQPEPHDRSLTLALSAPAVGVASLPAAAEEARFIAALQRAGQLQRQAASFDSLDDLGALKVLYQLRQSPELRQFVEQVLGALAGRETLRSTLRVFLESGGSQVEASKRLGIHRNTLSYRLRRVATLVGIDVTDPAAWLTLHLALSAADLLRLTSADN